MKVMSVKELKPIKPSPGNENKWHGFDQVIPVI
jgi:hypothetical protein